jgi:hypothetical protein
VGSGFFITAQSVPLSANCQGETVLGVSVEELLGLNTVVTPKRGPTPKLQQQLERLSRLPRAKQRFVSEMLETVLQQASR